jgi:hypothetical protein
MLQGSLKTIRLYIVCKCLKCLGTNQIDYLHDNSRSFLAYLIDIWQMSWQSHDLNHDQNPTGNIIWQNLLIIH